MVVFVYNTFLSRIQSLRCTHKLTVSLWLYTIHTIIILVQWSSDTSILITILSLFAIHWWAILSYLFSPSLLLKNPYVHHWWADLFWYIGNTALHDCAESGSVEIMELLLDHRARIEKDDHGMTPLFAAALSGYANIVEFLIRRYLARLDLTR